MFRPTAVGFTIHNDALTTPAVQELFIAFRDGLLEIVGKDGHFIGWTEDTTTILELVILDSVGLVTITANYPMLYTEDGTLVDRSAVEDMEIAEVRALLLEEPVSDIIDGDPV